jgi:hypothetical protein
VQIVHNDFRVEVLVGVGPDAVIVTRLDLQLVGLWCVMI